MNNKSLIFKYFLILSSLTLWFVFFFLAKIYLVTWSWNDTGQPRTVTFFVITMIAFLIATGFLAACTSYKVLRPSGIKRIARVASLIFFLLLIYVAILFAS